jgi:hypothetical protein
MFIMFIDRLVELGREVAYSLASFVLFSFAKGVLVRYSRGESNGEKTHHARRCSSQAKSMVDCIHNPTCRVSHGVIQPSISTGVEQVWGRVRTLMLIGWYCPVKITTFIFGQNCQQEADVVNFHQHQYHCSTLNVQRSTWANPGGMSPSVDELYDV